MKSTRQAIEQFRQTMIELDMNNDFTGVWSGPELTDYVRKTNCCMVMDGTVTNELRRSFKGQYIVVDSQKSQYRWV